MRGSPHKTPKNTDAYSAKLSRGVQRDEDLLQHRAPVVLKSRASAGAKGSFPGDSGVSTSTRLSGCTWSDQPPRALLQDKHIHEQAQQRKLRKQHEADRIGARDVLDESHD